MSKHPKIPTVPSGNELAARAEHEHGICFYGNHALCIAARVPGNRTMWTNRPECPPPVDRHVAIAHDYLVAGQWADGTGSYSLKHRAEEAVNGYVSNGALLLAAARLGLGILWSHPNFQYRSPNARIYKLGKVPAAARGRKKKVVDT